MKNPFLTSALSAGLIVLVGCETMYNMMDALNEAHTYNSSAIAGGGAVAGKDYITGLAPCEESRAYFAKSSSSQTEKVTVTPGNDKGTGVEWTDDGGIVIPPGVTIEFVNNGYCMDPHLPAPKSGEEIQLVKTASLLPNKMRGTYKNLMQRAAAGDEEIEDNMQRLVWALRTAGSDDAMATYLTDRQMEILEENSSSEYDGIDSFDGLFDKLMDDAKKQLAQTIVEATSVRIGNVTYNAFDLMDPDKGMEKVAAHMDALAAMSKNLPVAKTGFNYGQIENGIYTDIKGGSSDAPASGNGWLAFTAKIANATSQSYTFYPYDYVGQVGSGDNSSAGTFYATSSTSMRQRITVGDVNSLDAQIQYTPSKSADDYRSSKKCNHWLQKNSNWDDVSISMKEDLIRYARLANNSYNDLGSYGDADFRSASAAEIGGNAFADEFSAIMRNFYQSEDNGTERLASAFYIDSSGKVVLVFRGSDSFSDFYHDNLALVMGRVSAQLKYSREIVRLLNKAGVRFDIAGHSLGGYLAVMSAVGQSENVGSIYTYNAPGIDSEVLKKFGDINDVDSKTVNVWHTMDGVHDFNNSGENRHLGATIELDHYEGVIDWLSSHVHSLFGQIEAAKNNHSIVTLIKRMESNL